MIPDNTSSQTKLDIGRCEVCGGLPPHGHRFCDNCWPDATIAAGKAARCAVCAAPKVLEKLASDVHGRPVCLTHLTSY